MTTYKSETKTISSNEEVVFAIISDLNNLQKISDYPIATDKIKDLKFDTDSCSFAVEGFGRIGFKIVERKPNSLIKFESEMSPLPINAFIRLNGISESETTMILELNAEIPSMIKMMIDSKLQEGINKIADLLQKVLSK